MKNILSLLLLPIMVLSQPSGQHQNEHFDIEFSMDLTIESILNEEIDFAELVDGAIELFVTIEVYVWEMEMDYVIPEFTYNEPMNSYLPKYLNSFSWAGFPLIGKQDLKPQERLNRLLALNDPMSPKEDTLWGQLHPARYQHNKFGGAENMPEGFGPRIKF